jgi:thimet oligopeptidase
MIAMRNRYAPFPHQEGTYFYARFAHLADYSALYYCYLWSQAIARDLFTSFEHVGLAEPQVNLAYRRAILERGGSVPAAELVQSFLGRPWSSEAFRSWLERVD